MTELEEVFTGVERLWAAGEPAVVATVVRVSGSAYRRPGARMLVAPGGSRQLGMISGGCLEGDVARKAWSLTSDGSAALLRYDSTVGADDAWNLGLGCNGVVEILVERWLPDQLFFSTVRDWFGENLRGVVSLVFSNESSEIIPPGSRFMLTKKGTSDSTHTIPADLKRQIASDARYALAKCESFVSEYVLPTGRVCVSHELIEPAQQLIICGAGWDAVPLVDAAVLLGWKVVVVDRRPSRTTSSRFGNTAEVVTAEPQDLLTSANLSENTAVVIMNHDYDDDLACLQATLASNGWYVGLLGPARRRDKLLEDLRQLHKVDLPGSWIERLHAPIGLDIGAEGPSQIALSVIAEIVAVKNGRAGAMLTNRHAPIHDVCVQVTADRAGFGQRHKIAVMA